MKTKLLNFNIMNYLTKIKNDLKKLVKSLINVCMIFLRQFSFRMTHFL
jgi:hypothetical protein